MRILVIVTLLMVSLPCFSANTKKPKLDDVRKAPKSLFLIKKKIDEKDFGEPTLNLYDHQIGNISEDKRLDDPYSSRTF